MTNIHFITTERGIRKEWYFLLTFDSWQSRFFGLGAMPQQHTSQKSGESKKCEMNELPVIAEFNFRHILVVCSSRWSSSDNEQWQLKRGSDGIKVAVDIVRRRQPNGAASMSMSGETCCGCPSCVLLICHWPLPLTASSAAHSYLPI